MDPLSTIADMVAAPVDHSAGSNHASGQPRLARQPSGLPSSTSTCTSDAAPLLSTAYGELAPSPSFMSTASDAHIDTHLFLPAELIHAAPSPKPITILDLPKELIESIVLWAARSLPLPTVPLHFAQPTLDAAPTPCVRAVARAVARTCRALDKAVHALLWRHVVFRATAETDRWVLAHWDDFEGGVFYGADGPAHRDVCKWARHITVDLARGVSLGRNATEAAGGRSRQASVYMAARTVVPGAFPGSVGASAAAQASEPISDQQQLQDHFPADWLHFPAHCTHMRTLTLRTRAMLDASALAQLITAISAPTLTTLELVDTKFVLLAGVTDAASLANLTTVRLRFVGTIPHLRFSARLRSLTIDSSELTLEALMDLWQMPHLDSVALHHVRQATQSAAHVMHAAGLALTESETGDGNDDYDPRSHPLCWRRVLLLDTPFAMIEDLILPSLDLLALHSIARVTRLPFPSVTQLHLCGCRAVFPTAVADLVTRMPRLARLQVLHTTLPAMEDDFPDGNAGGTTNSLRTARRQLDWLAVCAGGAAHALGGTTSVLDVFSAHRLVYHPRTPLVAPARAHVPDAARHLARQRAVLQAADTVALNLLSRPYITDVVEALASAPDVTGIEWLGAFEDAVPRIAFPWMTTAVFCHWTCANVRRDLGLFAALEKLVVHLPLTRPWRRPQCDCDLARPRSRTVTVAAAGMPAALGAPIATAVPDAEHPWTPPLSTSTSSACLACASRGGARDAEVPDDTTVADAEIQALYRDAWRQCPTLRAIAVSMRHDAGARLVGWFSTGGTEPKSLATMAAAVHAAASAEPYVPQDRQQGHQRTRTVTGGGFAVGAAHMDVHWNAASRAHSRRASTVLDISAAPVPDSRTWLHWSGAPTAPATPRSTTFTLPTALAGLTIAVDTPHAPVFRVNVRRHVDPAVRFAMARSMIGDDVQRDPRAAFGPAAAAVGQDPRADAGGFLAEPGMGAPGVSAEHSRVARSGVTCVAVFRRG
ncbi:hypothetical protein AMAG_03871 [Allomyces macrogynus ATCC 38327]|uniref:Uncharacterized protein n=1 Tax=Allomyces macrogynus (strain ATCC 38327) TaxID=578462 RepID=A0A0L0SB37_ALLM3|nr:hypothetical protein AMAG_03871 [Allomyces macrogynus ATCC 38327]|eukprot:KNE59614.1 hypothetical protein AMAG_03871 [Allomyces macrogynus ATCC 38327]